MDRRHGLGTLTTRAADPLTVLVPTQGTRLAEPLDSRYVIGTESGVSPVTARTADVTTTHHPRPCVAAAANSRPVAENPFTDNVKECS